MTPARRARLSWLHRWAGLVTGWFAFAIFLTGTLALFDTELTRWMQPETAIVPENAQLTSSAMEHAQHILLESEHAGASPSFLLLPDTRDPTLRILHYDGHNFVGPVLDPRTGEVLHPRQTEGGAFFFTFHYTLRLPDPWGARVVACAAFAFAVLVLSGVLLHLKRLIPDYFTLRLQAALPRCLLDLHVLTGSAMLPFHILITWSGLVLTAENALPLIHFSHASASTQQSSVAQPIPPWAPRAPLNAMLQQARSHLNYAPSYVMFDGNETTFSAIQHNSLNANDLSVVFNSQTGEFTNKAAPATKLEDAFFILNGLHIARSMGSTLRWLWFCGGLASSIMIASGLIYYTARQKKHTTSTLYLAQRLNVALLGGPLCACMGFLLCNRIIPDLWPARASLEVEGFFCIWACCGLLAIAYPSYKSWKILCWAMGIIGLGVPVMDALVVPLATLGTALHVSINSLCALTALLCIGSQSFPATRNQHD
ncbi:PepSY-associated TM helix domain-containing protein [Acetobacter okinawensis]|uniref:PepSY-associated TM helix domain-containing protein n=1 Tax=Acetobacter okinawensis TaxID=1076594 RepID=UPI0020A1BEC6|nr:PepSY-associated TM helix domain-containing protein [Acetobacter okinawensis]MCP1211659.1 PepSY domain-containing protein [Acetobacter okinawensis]